MGGFLARQPAATVRRRRTSAAIDHRRFRMKPVLSCLLLSTLLASPAAFAHADAAPSAAATPAVSATLVAKQAATRAALRDLWVEHVFWIRAYVTSGAAHDAAQQAVAADQVVANATAIAGAVGGYYGAPAGDRMLDLLAGHWGAVKAYADATPAGAKANAVAQQAAARQLTANAKAIAAFLAGANPNLPEPTLVALLSAHGAHHVAQIGQVAQHDYAAEAKTWAAMRAHMLTIADALGVALVKQFPDKG
jgi:hypothetical protein